MIVKHDLLKLKSPTVYTRELLLTEADKRYFSIGLYIYDLYKGYQRVWVTWSI